MSILITLKTGKVIEDTHASAVEDREGWVRLMKGKDELRMVPRENVEQIEFKREQ